MSGLASATPGRLAAGGALTLALLAGLGALHTDHLSTGGTAGASGRGAILQVAAGRTPAPAVAPEASPASAHASVTCAVLSAHCDGTSAAVAGTAGSAKARTARTTAATA